MLQPIVDQIVADELDNLVAPGVYPHDRVAVLD